MPYKSHWSQQFGHAGVAGRRQQTLYELRERASHCFQEVGDRDIPTSLLHATPCTARPRHTMWAIEPDLGPATVLCIGLLGRACSSL